MQMWAWTCTPDTPPSPICAPGAARIPRFVWEYLDSGTGVPRPPRRATGMMLDAVRLSPSILHGEIAPDLTTTLFGQRHPCRWGSRRSACRG